MNANRSNMVKSIYIAYEKGYRVTEDGRLIGLKGNELKVKRRGKQRYPTFSVNVGELTKSGVYGIPVHKFAAFCFYGEKTFSEELVVRHLNGDTEDVSINNIKLGTHSDNNLDKCEKARSNAAKKARASQGYRPNNAKLTDDQVREIRIRAKHESPKKFHHEYGVSDVTVYWILKGKRYSDVK